MSEQAQELKLVHVRDLYVRGDIMKKAQELADVIAASEEVAIYRKAEKQIQENERVQSIIKLIKKKQKELVAFETTFKNEQMVRKIEKEIEELQDELDQIPIVAQFQQTQADINYLLQMVVSVIKESLSEKINLDSDHGNPPAKCD
ncbi:hypothetical protein PRECH8_09390 [Insulibacter thermoxylanivorax]|uniref:Cell fate regulator YmcA, YheA/YmcA/DUF963 family (Controls sporulation, competence, biofilm development) n=1 Tax=Insulibacter thermoxylanivorax TaxID=2749268 RepID=A0A916VF98_9BACL|nr:YlbF family regulator [Insulibacter thermoxylanivorax]GFR37643.1 hypothetical protein PRECH8_09390 [Insulibacter thermoxylanivorax]